MIYICSQPDIPYFHWQVEVLLTNFQSIEIEKCHIIFIFDGAPSREGKMLEKKFPQYNFFFYKDERELRARYYIPTIKPYGMLEHFRNNKIKEAIFYHDSDIVLTEKLDEKRLEKGSKWYLSDTISYIGHDYVKSKGEDQLDQMCYLIGIDRAVVEANQKSSGGAQYVCKNTTTEFWAKVYHDSYLLYEMLCETEKDWKGEGYSIQKWCAEMWATLWNVWLFDYKTVVDKELDFEIGRAHV